MSEVARTYPKHPEPKKSLLQGKELVSVMSKQSESTKQPEPANPLDPFESLNKMRDANLKSWYSMRDAGLESWSKVMIDLVNSEAYSKATGQWLDTYLTVSQPFQDGFEKNMTQALSKLNMPIRSEVTSIAQRLTHIELRLDDLDTRFDDIQQALQALTASIHAANPSRKVKENR